MKKNLFIGLFLAIIVLNIAVLSAAADTITVAINPDAKPFKYIDEDGEFAGIDADVIQAIAEIEDLEIHFIEMPFENIFNAVKACEVDAAISALSKTEARTKVVSFSDPYVMSLQSAFVRMKNIHLSNIADPAIKVIGAKAATTAEDNGRIIAQRNNCELKVYATYSELFAALENDAIDAAIADEMLAKEYVDSYADIMTIGAALTSEPYAIAVCPENSELLEAINHGLNEMRKEGKLDEIVLSNLNPEK